MSQHKKTNQKIITLLITISIFLAAMTALAQSHSASDIVAKVQQTFRDIGDASADFTQSVSFKYAKIEQSFSGIVRMKKGNRYRIESQQQTVVTDGKTVWVYSPVNQQVVIDSYKENPQTFSPDKFMLTLPANFIATLLNERNTQPFLLKLVPKEGGASFVRSLKATVHANDWSISRLEYIDANNTQTIYTIKNLRRNIGLSDSLFSFSLPESAEVIDLRGAGTSVR